MTPAARVQAAIEVIDLWLSGETGLDRVLTAWARGHRFAGSGDRRAISDLVHDAVRRRRSALWRIGEDALSGHALMLGSLMLDGVDPTTIFTGIGHAPAPLESVPPARDLSDAPRAVRFDLPDWIAGQMSDLPDASLEATRRRAPLDLRVNLLGSTVEDAIAMLADEGVAAAPLDWTTAGLRVSEGARKVANSAAYREGIVEIQDAASQAVAALGAARPEEVVLDLCAGGGGKTLALAVDMAARGRLIAHDIAPRRMQDLPARADRAGAVVETIATEDLVTLAGACDLVFVDAPCSGSGAWRRNPDAKWHLSPEGLEQLEAVQADLLDQAATLAAPGGRILYATCSLLDRENSAQVQRFLERTPGWALEQDLTVLPPLGDGFFGALLRDKANSRKN